MFYQTRLTDSTPTHVAGNCLDVVCLWNFQVFRILFVYHHIIFVGLDTCSEIRVFFGIGDF